MGEVAMATHSRDRVGVPKDGRPEPIANLLDARWCAALGTAKRALGLHTCIAASAKMLNWVQRTHFTLNGRRMARAAGPIPRPRASPP